MTKYKRKFLVQGNTLKKDYFDQCRQCYKDNNRNLPCNPRPQGGFFISFNYRQQPDNCPHKETLFNQYIVSEPEEGPWQCSCKGWILKYKKQGQDCDHIKKVKKDPSKFTEIAIQNTGTTIEAMKRVFEKNVHEG